MDPEGPSPGMPRSAAHSVHAPSTIFSDSDDEDGFVVPDSRIPQITSKSPTNSISSSAFPLPPPSLPSVSQVSLLACIVFFDLASCYIFNSCMRIPQAQEVTLTFRWGHIVRRRLQMTLVTIKA